MDAFFNFLSVCLIGGLFLLTLHLLQSCTKQESLDRRESNSKCFEQTQDKQCWGLK